MICYFRGIKGCAVVSCSLLSDLVFYRALRMLPQRIEYSKAKAENRIKLRKKYGPEIYNDTKEV